MRYQDKTFTLPAAPKVTQAQWDAIWNTTLYKQASANGAPDSVRSKGVVLADAATLTNQAGTEDSSETGTNIGECSGLPEEKLSVPSPPRRYSRYLPIPPGFWE